ncbi:hypothetical protein LTR08_000885 [Meristemomyces frigidus]|nr:hypothetical protein LTR08_000885 [Meristemomyces frigidus]
MLIEIADEPTETVAAASCAEEGENANVGALDADAVLVACALMVAVEPVPSDVVGSGNGHPELLLTTPLTYEADESPVVDAVDGTYVNSTADALLPATVVSEADESPRVDAVDGIYVNSTADALLPATVVSEADESPVVDAADGIYVNSTADALLPATVVSEADELD